MKPLSKRNKKPREIKSACSHKQCEALSYARGKTVKDLAMFNSHAEEMLEGVMPSSFFVEGEKEVV